MPANLLNSLFSPIAKETQALLAQRWASLPDELKSARQVVGKHWVHCGYITGPLYCSLGCTHCYLPKNANRMAPPRLNQLKQQIDANRKFLGPGGHLQITGGDLVDAYIKTGCFEDLVEVIRYTNQAGLVPMLMTHGQALLEQPQRLHRLVLNGGLRKISFHIDITQAGRRDYSIKTLRRESDLNSLRDAFTDLVLSTRKHTGKRLVGAQTITVSQKNINSIGDIIEWQISNIKNPRAFSTLSFQPEADVGRTRISRHPVTAERVWQTLCQATGKNLTRDALHFGHPDCSSIAMLAVDVKHKRLVDLMQDKRACIKFWASLLNHFGGIGGRGEHALPALISKLALVVRHPSMIVDTLRYINSVIPTHTHLLQLSQSYITGNVGAFKIVMHNFIDAEKLKHPDKIIQARLKACSFKGAIKIQGQWQAVPMCLTNAKYR